MSSILSAAKPELFGLCRGIITQQSCCLHANRAQICRLKRAPNQYCRQYPTKIVFQDGSSVTARHQVPREIIKLPFLYEDCLSDAERKQWMSRRKKKEVIEIKKDDTSVEFDQMQYIKNMRMAARKRN